MKLNLRLILILYSWITLKLNFDKLEIKELDLDHKN